MAFDAAWAALQRRWRITVVLYALGLVGLGLFLRAYLPSWQVLLWLGLSGVIGFYILSYLYAHLPDNIPEGTVEVSPRLGAGTALSLIGGWLLASLGGFILFPRPQGLIGWLPAWLFLGALLVDLLDGWLARRTGHVTRLGANLDMTLDGLGVLLASILVVRWGQWPFWFLIVGLARYLFIWGLAWRHRQGLPTQPLEESVIRRLLAGMQRGFLLVSLWPMMPPWLATATGLAFVIPFLVNFTYDWLVASMVIDDREPDFRAVLQRWQRWAYGPIAIIARVLTSAMVAGALWQSFSQHPLYVQALAQRIGLPTTIGIISLGVGVFAVVLLLAGIMARIAALVLYFVMGLILIAEVSYWPALLAFYGLTAVILLGPGPWALWMPEEKLFTQRLGG